jgi:hypothetical protein
MFAPAIAATVVLGRLLSRLLPHPGVFAILALALVFIALFVISMLIGATFWLVVIRRLVQREILASFFLAGPRVPIFSALCSKAFAWSERRDQTGTGL